MKLTVKDFLANRSLIGSAAWELAYISEADSKQIPLDAMAEGLGKTRRSVETNVRRLAEVRVIGIQQVPGQPNIYTILLGENGDAR